MIRIVQASDRIRVVQLRGASGKSAFELAQAAGYEGTPEEFEQGLIDAATLVSLRVGLFADLGTLEVPEGVDLIRTSGYATKGVGAGVYVSVPVGPATVYRKQSLNGRWFELLPSAGKIDVLQLGATPDGTTDVAPIINAGWDISNHIEIAEGAFGWATDISILGTTTRRLSGRGKAVLKPTADAVAVRVSGQGVTVEDFWIESTRTTSQFTTAFINCDSTARETRRLRIRNIIVDAPTHGKNLILLKAQSGCNITDVEVTNCEVLRIGRMGVEVLSDGTGLVSDLTIDGNRIRSTGGIANGMGVSLSGAVRNARVTANDIADCPNAWVELVGALTNVSVNDNDFSGTSANAVISSNATSAVNLEILGNRTAPGATGAWQLSSCPGARVCDNTIVGGAVTLGSPGIWFYDNKVFSNGSSALIINNVANCVVEDNLLDNSASTNNFSTVRAYNTGAINNIIRNNRVFPGTGGENVDQSTGASKNLIYGNRLITGASADNSPAPGRLVVSTATAARTVSFANASGSWRTHVIRLRLTGCESDSNNPLYSFRDIVVRTSLNAAPVQIANQLIVESGVTIALTYTTNLVTITATPAAGTPTYLWDIELVSPLSPAIARAA